MTNMCVNQQLRDEKGIFQKMSQHGITKVTMMLATFVIFVLSTNVSNPALANQPDTKEILSKLIFFKSNFTKINDLKTLNLNLNKSHESNNNLTNHDDPHVLWERLRKNFDMAPRFNNMKEQQQVQKFVKQYQNNEKQLKRFSKASPYLHYIIEELERRDMPGELALLPMIESAFEPEATSRKGAAGLWQFMRGTGKQFGLKQDKWYDGRRDIRASTHAALDYLKALHKEFDDNWMLALAAYNAGPGNVRKAIKRNKRAGKPTHFWALKLPKETLAYVPKFLALAEVINNPVKHKISLPHIANKPYFVQVDADKNLTFNKVAKLADIQVQEVKRLNPCFRKSTTHPKELKQILLPAENAKVFEDNVSKS